MSSSCSSSSVDDIDLSSSSGTVSLSDVECALCCEMLYDPVTTSQCGHTFCRQCLFRSLEVKQNCPLCRSSVHMDVLSHPPTAFIQHLLQRLFAAEWKRRKKDTELERRHKSTRYGLFLSPTPILPYSTLQLHIFEPRYRVLLNRAMSSTRQFVYVHQHQPAIIKKQKDWNPYNTDNYREDQPDQATQANNATESKQSDEAKSAEATNPSSSSSSSSSSTQGNTASSQAAPSLPTLPPESPYPISNGSIGCLMKIQHVRAHPDGRSFIECVSTDRVILDGIMEEDASFGLLTSEIEIIKDEEEEDINNQYENDEKLDQQSGVNDGEMKSSHDDIKSDDSILRNRFDASQSGTAESDVQTTPISASAAQINESIQLALNLLDEYCKKAGTTIANLSAHYGAQPSSNDADLLCWWLMRVVPPQPEYVQQAIVTRSRVERWNIVCQLLQSSVTQQTTQGVRQQWIIGTIILLVAIMKVFSWLSSKNYF